MKHKLNVTQEMLIEKIFNTPLSDWSSWDFVEAVSRVINDRRGAWHASPEKIIHDRIQLARENVQHTKRREADTRRRRTSVGLAKTLKPGDVIKVRGARDRTGFREVQSVDPLIGGLITAQKLTVTRWHSSDADITLVVDGRKVYCNREPYITTHGKDKVMKVLEKYIW